MRDSFQFLPSNLAGVSVSLCIVLASDCFLLWVLSGLFVFFLVGSGDTLQDGRDPLEFQWYSYLSSYVNIGSYPLYMRSLLWTFMSFIWLVFETVSLATQGDFECSM